MLAQLLAQVAAVVGVLLAISIGVFVGQSRLSTTRAEWRSRVRDAAPIAVVLVLVLLFNRTARETLPSLSWSIGWNLTSTFYEIEGQTVLLFQEYATPELTAYFSYVYVYGYVFVLIFPVVAYFALSDTRPLRELLTAYTLNYTLGLLCYVLIIAYGPRNWIPDLVETTMLYNQYPQYQELTGEVNHNTNVFPSLHTSLSATVAMFAYRTRDAYPKWVPAATLLAASVAVSTMYLAIHWAIDVTAGLCLGAISVVLSRRLVGRWSLSEEFDDWWPSLRRE
ncbi:phosphatase PAP2 family protein [Natribaculum luteum]|uniref:Phosphatase PAP2 family protein n=1 Tax=Natribaculum luteum TaxID=1586232 RepID=A0ABD5P4V3_9EURY|nr:phosphatase PAP2 family protein [Natribaculum luteum]